MTVREIYHGIEEVPTYSAAVWSSTDDVVLKLKVGVEYIGVELNSAVELIADSLPINSGGRHGLVVFSSY